MFFARWLRNPLGVGSVIPSGVPLSTAMAAPAIEGHRRPVLELGGGTGSVTTALLRGGLAPGDLIVMERDPDLHAYLCERFPAVRVVRGDAAYASRTLKAAGIAEVGAVVSSLPLVSMPLMARRRIIGDAFRCLARDGFLLQFTYGPRSPVPARMMATLGIWGRPVARVWRNVPPATVWRYERVSRPAAAPNSRAHLQVSP